MAAAASAITFVQLIRLPLLLVLAVVAFIVVSDFPIYADLFYLHTTPFLKKVKRFILLSPYSPNFTLQ